MFEFLISWALQNISYRHVHLLKMAQNPVNLFLGFAMQVRWEKFEKEKVDTEQKLSSRANWSRRIQSARHFPLRSSTCWSWLGISGDCQISTSKWGSYIWPRYHDSHPGWQKGTFRRQWASIANPGQNSSRRRSSSLPVAMWLSFSASYRLTMQWWRWWY